MCCVIAMGAGIGGAGELDSVQPYSSNHGYWQYKGAPILLLGGSEDDSLFQILNLESHLNEIKNAGGNYVRNTMSDRRDNGFEVSAFKTLPDGKYDLDQWNEEYWNRFANFLRLCEERDIIVQIEVWDRFDHSQEHWRAGPWRPANNVNYTPKSSGLANEYGQPAWRDRQPFFHSIPGMPLYQEKLDAVRAYHERFVKKMLSYSLKHGNVLYCMDNETSTPVAWGQHWMSFIETEAKANGRTVFVTDMFDDAFAPARSAKLAQALREPGRYPFIDISQVNSRVFNEDHWNNLMWIVDAMKTAPRPLNHVKIYSDGETNFGSGTPKDGVERFWRDLIAGSAACRFHRPGAGIGLNDIARACIKSARSVEQRIRFWDVSHRMDLLRDRDTDEAYLAAAPGERYLLYFTDGGSVTVEMRPGVYDLVWTEIASGNDSHATRITADSSAQLDAPGPGGWVATLVKATSSAPDQER